MHFEFSTRNAIKPAGHIINSDLKLLLILEFGL